MSSVQLLSVVWFTRQHAANKTVLIQRRNSCKLKCARDRPHWKPTQAACVISIYTVSIQYLHSIYTISTQYLQWFVTGSHNITPIHSSVLFFTGVWQLWQLWAMTPAIMMMGYHLLTIPSFLLLFPYHLLGCFHLFLFTFLFSDCPHCPSILHLYTHSAMMWLIWLNIEYERLNEIFTVSVFRQWRRNMSS